MREKGKDFGWGGNADVHDGRYFLEVPKPSSPWSPLLLARLPLPTGSGDLSADYFLKELPLMLSLEEKKTKPIVKEIVSSRKRMLLVQAVSQYRQKRPAETVVSLQNLLRLARVEGEGELCSPMHRMPS